MCCEDSGTARYIVEEVSDERRCNRACFLAMIVGPAFFALDVFGEKNQL
jgi:hypothetical protein